MLREILWEDWITNPSQGYEIKTNTLYKQNITLLKPWLSLTTRNLNNNGIKLHLIALYPLTYNY